MQLSKFRDIIQTGNFGTSTDLDDLQELARKFPYCSTLHVLSAVTAKKLDSIDQKEFLEKAAIYIQDREKLYDYIIKDSLEVRLKEAEGESTTINVDSQEELEIEEYGLSMKPLEEEIMREAIVQLGELESQANLDTAAQEPDLKASTEKKAPTSFGSWLLSLDGISASEKESSPAKELIEKFIQESPQINPVKAAFFSPSQVGKMSLMEDETFVTETLAKVYERQGDYKRAARAYKNLVLKYPEKSSYFAALQKKAEEQIKK